MAILGIASSQFRFKKKHFLDCEGTPHSFEQVWGNIPLLAVAY